MSDTLDAALARAQAKFAAIHKKHTAEVPTKAGGKYTYSYADLADVLTAVRPVLNAEGIAVVQTIDQGDLVTQLRRNGEAIESRLPLDLNVRPQELGSQLTYLRRYALSAIAGVASEDDDDGHAASTAKPAPRARSGRSTPPESNDSLRTEFNRLCDAVGIDSDKDKAGFIQAAMGNSAAKWSQLTDLEQQALVGDLTAIANGEKQLSYDNVGRPQAVPLGDPFLDAEAAPAEAGAASTGVVDAKASPVAEARAALGANK